MDWYYCVLLIALYLTGVGCMLSCSDLTSRSIFANYDFESQLLCSVFWVVYIWIFIGGLIMEKINE